MSRRSTASTSVAAATKFILAAYQKGFSVFIEGKLSIESSERNPKSSVVMEWTNNHDLALAREVLLLEPFRLKARTVERGKVWQTIADNLNSHATLRFLVTKKSVREHLKLLLDKYRARMQKERRDSGVEVEQTELDQALEEINEKWEAADEQDILLLNNRKKTEEDRAMGEEVGKKACEKLGETMKRKGEGEGSSEPKKKRSRKGGNDTIEFLREKANIDMAMKQEEQKARREEHERQTRLCELALANQQQQQQQSNQLLSLMFGLMQKIAEK